MHQFEEEYMLKKLIIFSFLLLLLPVTSFAEGKTTLTILYTGDMLGKIKPVRH